MGTTLTVPVIAPNLETHEILDESAHEQIAQTEDEDYKWLTDRLDALSAEVSSLRSSQANQFQEMNTMLSSNQEQSRLLIQAQSEMITNLLSSVTALSESALLRSTPTILETPSVTEQPIVTVQEIEPAAVEVTPENRAEERAKKHRRI